MKEKKLIAFDLYDTCFAFTIPQENLSYKKLFSDLGVLEKRHELKEALLTSHKSIEEILHNIYPDVQITHKHMNEYHENLRNEIESVQLFPETMGVISALQNRGYKIAAISNLSKPYIEVLHRLLPHTFNYEVLSCDVGVSKPDKKIFDCLKNISGHHADEIVMIGDNILSDIQGAQNANIDAVHINRVSLGIIHHKDYISIPTLQQLLDIL